MKKTNLLVIGVAFTLTLVGVIQVPSAHSEPMLKMVAIKADAPGQIHKLARMGIDISEVVKGPVIKGPRGRTCTDLSGGGGRLVSRLEETEARAIQLVGCAGQGAGQKDR